MNSTFTQPEIKSTASGNESPVVLRASGLRKSFGGQVVLNGVDVELRRGQVVLLEGENGSGKTTLLNILTGNLEADAGTIRYSANSHPTEYQFPRSWFQRFNIVNRFSPDSIARHGIGRTWQDVRLFKSLSLRDNIALGQPSQWGENPFFALFGNAGPTLRGGRTHIAAPNTPDQMLTQLGLSGREQSSGDMISLGQSKRVAIARAIAAGAKVLFLDEPLAGLDRNGIDEVLGMLSKLVAEHEITIVIVEHVFNQTHLRDLVTTRWHLANGKITVGAPKQRRTDQTSEQPHWFQQLTEAADEIFTEQLPRGATLTRFRINNRYKPNPVLEIKDLIVKRGKRTVIGLDDEGDEAGFNLTINEGEIVVFQAPNGWGKSTFVSAVSGFLIHQSGRVVVKGNLIKSLTPWLLKREGISILNSSNCLFDSLFKPDQLRMARGNLVVTESIRSQKRLGSLSGGERKTFALESLFASLDHTKVAILDEPFLGMDSQAETIAIERVLSHSSAILILQPYYVQTEEILA